jgi:hypothetical protein
MLDGTISYVGCTTNLKNRQRQHITYNPNVDKLEELENVEDSIASERELCWINKLISEGQPLKNRENKNRDGTWKHSLTGKGYIQLTTRIDPEVFKNFKIELIRQGITIDKWLNCKITEEAENIIIESS